MRLAPRLRRQRGWPSAVAPARDFAAPRQPNASGFPAGAPAAGPPRKLLAGQERRPELAETRPLLTTLQAIHPKSLHRISTVCVPEGATAVLLRAPTIPTRSRTLPRAFCELRVGVYEQGVETGYYILPDRMIRGPSGKTSWSVVGLEHGEAVWGRAGDSGWRIVGSCFFDPRGAQTSYFVIPNGDGRAIHGPDPQLPWA